MQKYKFTLYLFHKGEHLPEIQYKEIEAESVSVAGKLIKFLCGLSYSKNKNNLNQFIGEFNGEVIFQN